MIPVVSVCSPLSLLPEATLPVRSPRTSIVLAEVTRQRRRQRRQRRHARSRRAAWLGVFDPRPFESSRTHAAPRLLFAGAMPLVYTLQPSWMRTQP